MMYPVRHLSVAIQAPPDQVYRFMVDIDTLPQWAGGLAGQTLEQEGEAWVTDSPMGRIGIRFVPTNAYGVVDHDVTLPDGEVNHNPLRVLPNGDGSEVVFTLYRLPRMDEAAFEQDAAQILRDLQTLKRLVEAVRA